MSLDFSLFLIFEILISRWNRASQHFLFVPDWYFREHHNEYNLVPLLRPQKDGGGTYRKVLLARKQSDIRISDLTEHSLAMTAWGSQPADLLKLVFPQQENHRLENMQIIQTSKDADALFAVALNQVDAALVSESTYQQFASINKNLTRNLQIITRSEPLALPVLCYVKDRASHEEVSELQNMLMKTDVERSFSMSTLLQFDGWVEVDE